MKNSDLYILMFCEEDIRSSLDELWEGGRLSEKGELRLQTACAVAAELTRYSVPRSDGAFEPKDGSTFRQLSGRLLSHEAGHLLVAIDKVLKAETEQREKPASWGGAAAQDLAVNDNLNAEPQEASAAVFPPPGFQDQLRTIAATVGDGVLVPPELAVPAFREAVYALALKLPRFALPGDFNRLTSTELIHEAHHLVVYAAMCLRQWGSKADRQVAAICESLANARFPKLP